MTEVQRVPGRGADVGKAAMSEAHETQGVGDLRHYMPVGKKYTLELCRLDLSPVAVQTLPPKQMSTLYLGAILEL